MRALLCGLLAYLLACGGESRRAQPPTFTRVAAGVEVTREAPTDEPDAWADFDADTSARAPRAQLPSPPVTPRQDPDHERVTTFVRERFSAKVGGQPPFAIAGVQAPGIALDAKTGAVTGTLAAPGTTVLRITDGARRERVLSIEAVPAPRATDRFVATTGNDRAAGTRAQPFATIRRALHDVRPGTVIFLAAGRYREDVALQAIRGEPGKPIVLRSLPGGRARLEGAQAAITWERATAKGAASHEWISREAFERGRDDAANRAAFADRVPFTRVLSYSKLEDLRAANQRFAANELALPGPMTVKGHHMPWTYFGPGVWHDPDSGRIHLRLAPTAHGVRDMLEYTGPTDPQHAAVSVWTRNSRPLAISRAAHVEVRDVIVVGGGEDTVTIEKSRDVTLDHVDILASTMGLVVSTSTGVRFLHGRIDGGIPPWSFRSDFKGDYHIAQADGTRVKNNLVRKTSRALIYVGDGTRNLEIAYSELENAHDLYLAGVDSSLHHCRIRNVHDEGLFISHVRGIDNLRIHHNVFERVLSAVSGVGAKPSGSRYVYRNLFDLRDPTASFRPGASPRGFTWRWGHMFKGVISAAPFYFYQNTIAVRSDKPGKPALWHYHALQPTPRVPNWFVNNVVMVTGADPGPLAFLPDTDYRATSAKGRPLIVSDGNTWIRPGGDRAPLFRCKNPRKNAGCAVKKWRTLDALRDSGLEQHSRFASTPVFARLQSLDAAAHGDDLRPAAGSPAVGAAIPLPADLPDATPPSRRRDTGALPLDAPPLHVGVDGRLRY